VRDFLLGVLDRQDIGGIAMPNGERLVARDGFAVVATSNSPPSVLTSALRSRFEVEIALTTPNPALVAKVNGAIPGLGDALADSFKDPTRALDPRKVQAMVRFIETGVASRTAALMCFGVSAPDLLASLNARGVQLP
jgi:MoxR-like ATPase